MWFLVLKLMELCAILLKCPCLTCLQNTYLGYLGSLEQVQEVGSNIWCGIRVSTTWESCVGRGLCPRACCKPHIAPSHLAVLCCR